MLSIARWLLCFAVLSFSLVYAGDYIYIRYKMARPQAGAAFSDMKVRQEYAVPQKNGRAEFLFGDPQTVRCVHSLFPHFGYTPCWYLRRKNATPVVLLIRP